jgi:hypothetical protein
LLSIGATFTAQEREMAQVTIKGHMLANHYDFMHADTPPVWSFSQHHSGKMEDDELVAAIPHSFTFDAPEINVVAGLVQSLEAAKKKALHDYQATVAAINDRLSKLQAIAHDLDVVQP